MVSPFLCVTPWPARVQRPLLHAGNPAGPEPAGDGGEERAEVQLQEEKGEAGETLQHQGGVTCKVHPGDRGQTGDAQPRVGGALCLVSTNPSAERRICVTCRIHCLTGVTVTSGIISAGGPLKD